MTVLGPLTTTFKASSTCTATTPQIYQIWTGSVSRYEQGPLFTSGSDCYPSAYDASPQHYYSPGICPHGYTAACSNTNTVQTRTAEETVLVCCPTVFDYTCLDPSETASWGCTTALTGAHALVGVTVVRDGTTSGYTVISESSATFAAHSIQVRFAAGDPVPLTQTPTDGTLPTVVLPKTTIPPNLPTDRSSAESPPPGPALSTPAAIGIGIGAALLFVLLAGLAFFCFRRRRRHRTTTDDRGVIPFTPPPVPPKDPNHRASTYTHHTHHTAATAGVYELSTPATAIFPHRRSQHSHFFRLDDDKSTRTLTFAGASSIGGRRSRTNTIATARSEETSRAIREEEDGAVEEGFPAGLAGNVKAHVAELEGGSGVMAELEASRPASRTGTEAEMEGSVPEVRERPPSLVPPPPIGGGGLRPASITSVTSSASWTIMKKEGVQATPWL